MNEKPDGKNRPAFLWHEAKKYAIIFEKRKKWFE
jgi:hypothetical protein